MFDLLKDFLTSEDAAVLGTGIGSILGGIVIAWRAVKKGKPSASPAAELIAGACKASELVPRIDALSRSIEELAGEEQSRDEAAEGREERAEWQRGEISKAVGEILKLVIRLDERTQSRRG